MTDNVGRRALKRLALIRYVIDLKATRAILRLKGEPRYTLGGACTGCGGCCETPMITVWAPLCYLRSTRWLIVTWHRVVNGFELLSADRLTRTFVFRCTHYDPATKRCDSYGSRPGMCRDYPANLLYDPNPEFLPACGFHPVAKNADLIRESFQDLDLTPDQRAELERRFHVRPPAPPPAPPVNRGGNAGGTGAG